MTKPLHVGRASQNGVIAAELAAKGFTGGHDALDPPWGFFQVFSLGDGFDADRIVGKLGNPHTIVSPGVSIKPYPCGVLGHPTMDAMRRLVIDARRASPSRSRRFACAPDRTSSTRCAIRSRTTSSRRSSARRSWSSAIALRRKAGIHEFTDEFVQSAPVQQMMAKVERVLDPEIEARGLREDPQHGRSGPGRRPAAGRACRRALSRRPRPAVHARGAAREVHRLRGARAVRHPASRRRSRWWNRSKASRTSASSCAALTQAVDDRRRRDEPGLDLGRRAACWP